MIQAVVQATRDAGSR